MMPPPKGPNRNLATARPGDMLSDVVSAKNMQSLQGGVTRANQIVFGPGDDKLHFGPFTLRKHQRAAASSTSSIVHFTITDFSCDDQDEHGHRYATAEVTFVACELSSPEVGDDIEVFDLMGCWLTDAAPLLIGRNGIAFKVAHERVYGDGCDWSIMAMCGSGVSC